ncbi:MucR family transcriptional regulator (plasmid) [Methylobacterium oryzae CBMB20]
MNAETDLEAIGGDNRQATDYIDLATGLVSAYLTKNHVQVGELPRLITDVHAALAGLGQVSEPAAPVAEKPTPAQIRKSITPDALISFIDGKPYKTLKRHLTKYGMTIEEYRARYGLPRDYPSTAPSYSEQRSALAKSLGLGNQRRKAAPKAADTVETIAEPPKTRGRKKAAESVAKPARARKSKGGIERHG